jgi:hypothetical protein
VAPSPLALLSAPTQPRATLAFDHLERRFEQRWQALFARAGQALQAGA